MCFIYAVCSRTAKHDIAGRNRHVAGSNGHVAGSNGHVSGVVAPCRDSRYYMRDGTMQYPPCGIYSPEKTCSGQLLVNGETTETTENYCGVRRQPTSTLSQKLLISRKYTWKWVLF